MPSCCPKRVYMWAEYEQAASWKITAATADAAVTKGGEA